MSTDLDRLLRETVREPDPIDPDALWARGRRRRVVRRVAGATSALAVGAAVVLGGALLLPAIGGSGPVSIAPVGSADDPGGDTSTQDEPVPSEQEGAGTDPEGTGAEGPTAEDPPVEEPATEDVTPSPEPDPAALADPCAAHVDRQMESFVEVVSPVAGQQLTGEVVLVGCSNVYEATVQYRLLDGEGTVVDQGFTTATCGSGCVGEFEHVVAVPSAGSWVLQVFTEDAADGSEQDLTEVAFLVE